MDRLTLHDPHDRQDDIGQQQEADSPVHNVLIFLGLGNADQKEANGYLGPHEGSEGLNPFAKGVFAEEADLSGSEMIEVRAEAVMYVDETEGGADGCAELFDTNLAIW